MRSYTVYVCEKCGFESRDASLVEKCEARHMGLTVEELRDYSKLKSTAAHAGAILASVSNEATRKKFDDAIDELTKFEIEHNIKG